MTLDKFDDLIFNFPTIYNGDVEINVPSSAYLDISADRTTAILKIMESDGDYRFVGLGTTFFYNVYLHVDGEKELITIDYV